MLSRALVQSSPEMTYMVVVLTHSISMLVYWLQHSRVQALEYEAGTLRHWG